MPTLDADVAIPAALADVDPDWLTAALRHGGLDVTVDDVSLAKLGVGEGFMSQLGQARLRYADGSDPAAPASVVVKLPPTDPAAVQQVELTRMCEREARFYTEVADTIDVRVPDCYYAGGTVGTQQYALVLEDLAPAKTLDQLAGIGPDQARVLLDRLAEFHATWWSSPRLDELDWMPMVTDPQNAIIKMLFDASYGAFCDRYRAQLPEKVFPWVEAFADRAVDWLAGFADDELTIVHGDFRLDNVLAMPEGGYAVLDWQLAMRAHCMGDVVYFLVMNFDPEVRREHDLDLLDHYVDALAARGVDVSGLDRDERRKRYREGLLFYALSMSAGIAGLDGANERGVQALDTMVTRVFAAAADHDAGVAV